MDDRIAVAVTKCTKWAALERARPFLWHNNTGQTPGLRKCVSDEAEGTSTNFGYDGVSRLTSLAHVLPADSSHNLTITPGDNAASQIKSEGRDNTAYSFTGLANANTTYTSNGLNQVTSAGGTLAAVLGFTGGVGKFTNLTTGTAGYYFTAGVGGGVEGEVGGGGGVSSSMSAFLGLSGNVTGAGAGVWGTFSLNTSGSSVSASGALGAGTSVSLSYTGIFRCTLGQ